MLSLEKKQRLKARTDNDFFISDCRSWYLLTLEKELVLKFIEGHD